LRPAKLTIPFLYAALLALPGCAIFSDSPHYRGVAVSQHDLGELTPGLSQQADVQAVLGPPTFTPQFNANDWVYVAQVTKMRIAQTEGVKSQNVVVLAFDNNGTLQSITQKTLKDSVGVAMESHQTPVPGGTPGFFQQLIGGVGSYNPLGSAQDTSGGVAGTGSNVGAPGSGSGGGTSF
jgi:outer membrane protein assembly factor BamE (lipoprotein component of BamABCDE complex)